MKKYVKESYLVEKILTYVYKELPPECREKMPNLKNTIIELGLKSADEVADQLGLEFWSTCWSKLSPNSFFTSNFFQIGKTAFQESKIYDLDLLPSMRREL